MRTAGVVSRAAGFSLIELLVAAAILGLLATVAMPMAELTIKREKEHELRVALRDIRQAIDAYKTASAGGKITVATGQSGYPPTLTELVSGVTDKSKTDGSKLYFLRRIPRDPFDSDSTKTAIETWGLRSYASEPDAPHSGDDVFDVYSQSTQQGLNGVAYNEW